MASNKHFDQISDAFFLFNSNIEAAYWKGFGIYRSSLYESLVLIILDNLTDLI